MADTHTWKKDGQILKSILQKANSVRWPVSRALEKRSASEYSGAGVSVSQVGKSVRSGSAGIGNACTQPILPRAVLIFTRWHCLLQSVTLTSFSTLLLSLLWRHSAVMCPCIHCLGFAISSPTDLISTCKALLKKTFSLVFFLRPVLFPLFTPGRCCCCYVVLKNVKQRGLLKRKR